MVQQQLKWMQASTTARSPAAFLLYVFAALYITAVLGIRHVAWRDPTSIFFRPNVAYAKQYSNTRLWQSEEFLLDAAADPSLKLPPRVLPGNHTKADICIGVPSIARKGASYLRTTIGSLLEGLEQEERDRIHLIVFIAETDPRKHPAYHELWLLGLADQLLLYDLPEHELKRVGGLEDSWKGLYDYQYLLRACHATGSQYVALIEDDVLAMEGWFRRTMNGLNHVTASTRSSDWLYLRLFYTEEFLGWNGEYINEHIGWPVSIIVAAGTALFLARCYAPHLRRYLTNGLILSVCCICIPLLTVVFFEGGRATLFPLAHGVHQMNKNGCCSQGLVFNREKVMPLVDWIEVEPRGLYFDMMVEKYAEDTHLQRWAVQPPVLQHTGMKSSSEGEQKSKRAKKIWSFQFERYDADDLEGQHKKYKEDLKHKVV